MKSLDKPLFGPVFVQNPDGSIAEGIPPGFIEQTPPGTPRMRARDTNTGLSADIIRMLAKHECLFLTLMVLDLVASIIFLVLQYWYSSDAIMELTLLYPELDGVVLQFLHWMTFGGEMCYTLASFGLGVASACIGKPSLYARCAVVAMIGTLGQLPLAYLNRFNLLIFFLRFISYAYSRFLCNLLRTLEVLQMDLGNIDADP
mmetsp:Transcript_93358/g.166023  ORF Transcript_93358/g.166023 Transcript_93358/m.166023 type:complete len:202 (-) Transcript_93358:30-635(-)